MARELDNPDALMSAYAQGQKQAFERLYALLKDPLYRFVKRRLGSNLTAQVDEVFQETWMRVINSRSSWSPQGASCKTWLFTIANHLVIDRLRQSGREISVHEGERQDGDAWEPEGEAWQLWPDPQTAHGEDIVFWKQAGTRLVNCLGQLPDNQKATFLLHHQEGFTLEEIAGVLTVGIEAAKSRLRYAISKLRTCMGAYLEPLQ
jgi:RNA polymerase sigma factor (sigma-70 family)